ncbi:hypothetical protein CPC08DRAFT_497967 [Agrocybe pediades]|nr:hypothetical protein CPC08DRAFT_497967 [Agrocybe pediades]
MSVLLPDLRPYALYILDRMVRLNARLRPRRLSKTCMKDERLSTLDLVFGPGRRQDVLSWRLIRLGGCAPVCNLVPATHDGGGTLPVRAQHRASLVSFRNLNRPSSDNYAPNQIDRSRNSRYPHRRGEKKLKGCVFFIHYESEVPLFFVPVKWGTFCAYVKCHLGKAIFAIIHLWVRSLAQYASM